MFATSTASEITFRKVQKEISALSRRFSRLGRRVDFIDFVCRQCGIDREYYSCFLGNCGDFAELVVLYLENEMREKIDAQIVQLEALA